MPKRIALEERAKRAWNACKPKDWKWSPIPQRVILSALRLVERETREECARIATREASAADSSCPSDEYEQIRMRSQVRTGDAIAEKIRALAEQGPPQEEEEVKP